MLTPSRVSPAYRADRYRVPASSCSKIGEIRRLHTCLLADLHQPRGLEKAPCIRNRSPRREVGDFVRVVLIVENLERTLARLFADAGGVVENLFPSRVVGDFVDDEAVLHEIAVSRKVRVVSLKPERQLLLRVSKCAFSTSTDDYGDATA